MDNISDIIKCVMHNMEWDVSLRGWEAVNLWSQVVGDNIASHSRAKLFKSGVLLIEVDNPIWSYHLSLLKGELKQKINFLLKGKIVKDIEFKLAIITTGKNNAVPGKKEKKYCSLPKTDGKELMLSEIMDEDNPISGINSAISGFIKRRNLLKGEKNICPCCGEPYSNNSNELCPYCSSLLKKYEQEMLLFIKNFPEKDFNDLIKIKPNFEEEKLFSYLKKREIKDVFTYRG